MKKLFLVVLGIVLFSSIAFCQDDDDSGLSKNVAKLSVPSGWGRLAGVVQTEVGTLLYFEAANGDIHVISQSTDLSHLNPNYYVITRN